MSPTHFKVKSLSGKIFTSVLAFTLGVIVAFSVAMTTIYYLSYERDAEAELAASAQDAARYLNATPSSDNSSGRPANMRFPSTRALTPRPGIISKPPQS